VKQAAGDLEISLAYLVPALALVLDNAWLRRRASSVPRQHLRARADGRGGASSEPQRAAAAAAVLMMTTGLSSRHLARPIHPPTQTVGVGRPQRRVDRSPVWSWLSGASLCRATDHVGNLQCRASRPAIPPAIASQPTSGAGP
jgi:hypothetical protein